MCGGVGGGEGWSDCILCRKPWYISLGTSSLQGSLLVPPFPTRWILGGGAVFGRRRSLKVLQWVDTTDTVHHC